MFNIKKNCDALINKLKPEFTNINFKCYNDCPSLTDCVNTNYFPKKKSKSKSKSKSSSAKSKSSSAKSNTAKSKSYSANTSATNISSKKKVGGRKQTKKRRLR